MTKERPILFSTSMVHAILNGKKTQTRRIVKEPFAGWMETATNPQWFESVLTQCPYGQPGDILWVRETWQVTDFLHPTDENYGYIFKASENGIEWEANDESWRWKPSIYMPRKACRILLKINGIRVERLQSISYEDCISEGVKDGIGHNADIAFRKLWESINGEESWQSNPFVWVISFERWAVKNPMMLDSI